MGISMSFHERLAYICLFFLLSIALRGSAFAQYNHPPESALITEAPPLNAELVKTGLYVFSGSGGNSLLRLSANGFILVNAGLPNEREALLRKVKKISDQPIRALILTDSNLSHAGEIKEFLESGTHIIAQQNTAAKLATPVSSELTA